MNAPGQPQTPNEPLTVLCSECGSVIEIGNPAAVILALHMANACEQVSDLFAHDAGE